MKVVIQSVGIQEIKVRPRLKETNVILSIREEGQTEATTYNLTGTYSGGWLILNGTFPFIDGRQYQLIVYGSGNSILWKGKAYCTSQQPEEFKLNPDLIP